MGQLIALVIMASVDARELGNARAVRDLRQPCNAGEHREDGRKERRGADHAPVHAPHGGGGPDGRDRRLRRRLDRAHACRPRPVPYRVLHDVSPFLVRPRRPVQVAPVLDGGEPPVVLIDARLDAGQLAGVLRELLAHLPHRVARLLAHVCDGVQLVGHDLLLRHARGVALLVGGPVAPYRERDGHDREGERAERDQLLERQRAHETPPIPCRPS